MTIFLLYPTFIHAQKLEKKENFKHISLELKKKKDSKYFEYCPRSAVMINGWIFLGDRDGRGLLAYPADKIIGSVKSSKSQGVSPKRFYYEKVIPFRGSRNIRRVTIGSKDYLVNSFFDIFEINSQGVPVKKEFNYSFKNGKGLFTCTDFLQTEDKGSEFFILKNKTLYFVNLMPDSKEENEFASIDLPDKGICMAHSNGNIFIALKSSKKGYFYFIQLGIKKHWLSEKLMSGIIYTSPVINGHCYHLINMYDQIYAGITLREKNISTIIGLRPRGNRFEMYVMLKSASIRSLISNSDLLFTSNSIYRLTIKGELKLEKKFSSVYNPDGLPYWGDYGKGVTILPGNHGASIFLYE